VRWLNGVGAVVGLGIATVAAAALEARAFQVTRHELALPARRPVTPGRLRILHISDTHFRPGERAKAAFLHSLAAQAPDLVVCTGDLLASAEGHDEFMAALGDLTALPGVFVFGSNDYYAPLAGNPLAYLWRRQPSRHGPPLPWQRLRDALLEIGWHDLTNTGLRLDVQGWDIEFRGADDAHLGLDRYPEALQKDPKCPESDTIIGVTHAPYAKLLDQMTADGVDLILAGHTHGGQICLPWGAVVANCDLPTDYVKGLHRYPPGSGSWLHVSAGVGSSPTFPLRTFCRPEACVVDVSRG